ncbi:MAG: PocR ligand-binding domain-containing protein [Armatimonadetes bacterium]|nr:PocR ligand-binding domain-containing protein [Armatimonadota bacterium]
MRTIETILKPDVQKIFDHFSSCFNIRILFYLPDGEMASVGLNRPDSLYCELIQGRLYGVKTCLDLDQAKRDEAAAKGEMICYQCHAGLIEAIKPVYFDQSLAGFIAIGQFRSCERIPVCVMRDWCGSYLRSDELMSAFVDLPHIPPQRIDDILALFSILVDYIVMQHLITPRGNPVVDSLVDYLETNMRENLRLADAARLVNKSPSTLSHLFTKEFGKSFKRTQIDIKLRKAEELMANTSELTITEVAAMVGYDDPLYFSRIYKKYRGISPIIYLRGCRSGQ